MDQLRKGSIIHVGTVVVGGGPATLGMLCNAMKNDRLRDMVTDRIVILEKSTCLGGGNLQEYLINSNTSADGFLACL